MALGMIRLYFEKLVIGPYAFLKVFGQLIMLSELEIEISILELRIQIYHL